MAGTTIPTTIWKRFPPQSPHPDWTTWLAARPFRLSNFIKIVGADLFKYLNLRARRWLDGSLRRSCIAQFECETTDVERRLQIAGCCRCLELIITSRSAFPQRCLVNPVSRNPVITIFSPWKFVVPFCCLLTRVYDSTRFLERTSFHSRPFTFSHNRAFRSADCCPLENRVCFGLMEFQLASVTFKTQFS